MDEWPLERTRTGRCNNVSEGGRKKMSWKTIKED